jgi:hypothetical protein
MRVGPQGQGQYVGPVSTLLCGLSCLSLFVVSVEGLVAIELRQATLSDAPAIRDLTRKAYAKWVPLIGREPMPMTADYDVAVRQHRFDLLVSHDSLAALIETVRRANSS